MNSKMYFLTTVILLFVSLSKTNAYSIYFGFTSSIFDAESNSKSGTGWSWEHTTQTLTLDSSYDMGFIDSDCTELMTIKYSGNVSILANTNTTISVDGPLHLIGETGARLTLTTDMSASWYLLDAKELTITGGTLICTGGYGIYTSDGDVTIDGATVTTTSSDSYGYGIRAKGGDINIINASVVNATGYYEAIYAADGSINIIESDVNLNHYQNLFTGFSRLHMTGGRLSFNGGTPPTLTSLSPASGPNTGGTDVTLTGDNFTGATTMKVGNAIYYVFFNSFSIISPTKIEFTTRAETVGTMDVYIQTEGGVGVLNNGFTYQTATSMADIQKENAIISPNPVKDILVIKNEELKIKTIEIFTANGSIIHRVQPNDFNYQLSIVEYPKGIYPVRVTTESGTNVYKIIKE